MLGNLLTDEEVAHPRGGRTNLGILWDYLEFIKTHLQGRLVDAYREMVSFFFSQINLHHNLHPLYHFFHL